MKEISPENSLPDEEEMDFDKLISLEKNRLKCESRIFISTDQASYNKTIFKS